MHSIAKRANINIFSRQNKKKKTDQGGISITAFNILNPPPMHASYFCISSRLFMLSRSGNFRVGSFMPGTYCFRTKTDNKYIDEIRKIYKKEAPEEQEGAKVRSRIGLRGSIEFHKQIKHTYFRKSTQRTLTTFRKYGIFPYFPPSASHLAAVPIIYCRACVRIEERMSLNDKTFILLFNDGDSKGERTA